MKTYLHGPLDDAIKLKLRCGVGDLDLQKRRKRYTNSRKEGDVGACMSPCGTTLESRTHNIMRNIHGGMGCVSTGDWELRWM